MAKNKKKFHIPEPQPVNNKITFSFEYYDKEKKYCLSSWGEKEIAQALCRLGEVNQKTFTELSAQSRTFRFHPVRWESTIEKNGFPDPGISGLSPFQFSLVGINDSKARIYGGYGSNVFYVVWFDLEHQIWPSFKKHT